MNASAADPKHISSISSCQCVEKLHWLKLSEQAKPTQDQLARPSGQSAQSRSLQKRLQMRQCGKPQFHLPSMFTIVVCANTQFIYHYF